MQLKVLGYGEKDADALSLEFAQQYLNFRKSGGSIDQTAQMALDEMDLSDMDIDFGKTGHFFFDSSLSKVTPENYFESVALMEEMSRKHWEEEDKKTQPLTFQPSENFQPFELL